MTQAQFLGIIALVLQGLNFVALVFAQYFVEHPFVALIVTGAIAFCQAVTGRVQGSNSPGK